MRQGGNASQLMLGFWGSAKRQFSKCGGQSQSRTNCLLLESNSQDEVLPGITARRRNRKQQSPSPSSLALYSTFLRPSVTGKWAWTYSFPSQIYTEMSIDINGYVHTYGPSSVLWRAWKQHPDNKHAQCQNLVSKPHSPPKELGPLRQVQSWSAKYKVGL